MFAEVVATPKKTPTYLVVAAVAKAILVDHLQWRISRRNLTFITCKYP